MKNTLIILFLLIVTISFAQQNQTNLKSEIDVGDGFILTTFLKIEQRNDQFTITSPKNADVRLFGWFKAKLGRILGKSPKKGILAIINCKQKGDSLIGNMEIPMLGKLKFKGLYKNDLLSGNMIKDDTIIVGTIKGEISQEKSIDYKFLFPEIVEITQNNIYSKTIFRTDEWKKFQKQLEKTLGNVQDDIELFFGFNMLSTKLPFSHFNLIIQDTINLFVSLF